MATTPPENHNAILPMFSPMVETPKLKYKTIVADPPWRYEHSWNAYRGTGKARSVTEAGDYPTMTPSEIMGLPVGNWADDRSHLYLWTTHKYLVQAHEIAAAWGFDVNTVLVWVKRKPVGDAWLGMGSYFRSVHEYVLFGVRGKFATKRNNQATVFYAPRGRHSEKPSTFYDIVESMSYGPYLDVFSRAQRMGWDCFGNEAYNAQGLIETLPEDMREGLVSA